MHMTGSVVCMPYVDRVLEVMGFGNIFRGWVRTLHSGAAAVFLLDKLSWQVAITFSIRQGDPLAMLIYIIQLELFLWTLHRALPGLDVAGIVELALAYVDDVDVLGDNDKDITMVDGICRLFERMSGAILNRNRKSAILGFSSWAGQQDWPLPWLHAPPALKVFWRHLLHILQRYSQPVLGGRHDGGAQGAGALGLTPPSHTPALEGRLRGVHLLQTLVSGPGAPPASCGGPGPHSRGGGVPMEGSSGKVGLARASSTVD